MSEFLRNACRALFAVSTVAIVAATLFVTSGVFALPFHAFVLTPVLILGGAATAWIVDALITESWPTRRPAVPLIRALPVPAC
jgi:hypothetical protein